MIQLKKYLLGFISFSLLGFFFVWFMLVLGWFFCLFGVFGGLLVGLFLCFLLGFVLGGGFLCFLVC